MGALAAWRNIQSIINGGLQMKRLLAINLGTALAALLAASASAQTIYPLNRAEILAGARFDLKVEFPGSPAQGAVKVTINGQDAAAVAGRAVSFVEHEDGGEFSAYWIRGVALTAPGNYVVEATVGDKAAR